MFGLAKALAKIRAPKTPKPPRKQGYILSDGKMGTLPDNAPMRYAAHGNSLVVAGTVWPPIIRDDGYRDNSELFQYIATGLNDLPAHNFVMERLTKAAAAYTAGTKTAVDVTNDVIKILQVVKQRENEQA